MGCTALSPDSMEHAAASRTAGEHQPPAPMAANRGITATDSPCGRFISYNVCGYIFEVTAKYEPPIRPIGTGAYGIVCSFKNSETDEFVAIKKISNAFSNKIIAKRTLREIKLLRHMHQENIVPIIDVIPPLDRGSMKDVYIVFELMDTDLRRVLRSSKNTINKHQCKLFLYQILRGLKYIHSAQAVHRDLKPDNILLDQDSLKLCDFGNGNVFSESDFLPEFVVTRWYRSPELLLGSSQCSPAIDVWSVGCIFMEIVNRDTLFRSQDQTHQLHLIMELIGTPTEDEMEFLNEHAKDRIRRLTTYPRQSMSATFPKVDPLAIDLVEKMLTFDPRRRITVERALDHPYLRSVRDITNEPVCPTSVSFDFEQQELSEEEMKELVYQEALAFNHEIQLTNKMAGNESILETPSPCGRFISYNVNDEIFVLTAKYKPPIQHIVRGVYGVVCSVLNSETNEVVAFKKIGNAFRNKSHAKMALREVKVLRHMMDHKNIVSIRDIIPPLDRESMKDVYIVFDLMDTDLYEAIHSNQISSEEHYKYILYQILRGLTYIHSANVTHRDLKPGNILLNNNFELKLCDFGHSRVAPESNFSFENVVTLWYRPPELLLGSGQYAAGIDMWSVGCIFMEMVNGKPLFAGEGLWHQIRLIMKAIGTPTEAEMEFLHERSKKVIRRGTKHPRRSLSAKYPNVDLLAIDLVEKMLTFDPRQRITAERALDHPYLRSVCKITDEAVCATPLSFEFDQDGLNEEQIKELVYQEALAFNPQFQHRI